MSKRTPGLPQRPRGFWQTPPAAVSPLIPFLPKTARYGEAQAGDGALINALANLWPGGKCVWASDIKPSGPGIDQMDCFDITAEDAENVGMWVINPPWPRGGQRGDPARSIIAHLCTIAPTWALLPWDFAANDYFGRIASMCSDILPIGRVSWMGNGKPGMDNACWARFDASNRHPTVLHARGVML